MQFRALSGLLALTWLALPAQAASFDKPLFTKTVDLGRSPSNPAGRPDHGIRAKVTCYFFLNFMIKEVDMGEKGAERLAIVPVVNHKDKDHTCSRLRDPGEKEINADEWSGYFKGVKGDLVFFDADDGWNGGMGFAVYDAKSGKKIFEDIAFGPLDFPDHREKNVLVRYVRVVDGGCAVLKSASCWDSIRKKFSLENTAAPDCKTGYEKYAQSFAQSRCETYQGDKTQCLAKESGVALSQSQNTASAIAYPAELVLDASPVVRAVAGEILCWPVD